MLFLDIEIDNAFEVLVLASDGLWDVVPNEVSILSLEDFLCFSVCIYFFSLLIFFSFLYNEQDAVSLARAEEEPEDAARKLMEVAFSRGSADNITCVVVKFNHGDLEAEANPETEAEAKPETEAEAKPETEAEAKPEAEAEAKPEAEAETETTPSTIPSEEDNKKEEV